MKLVFFGTSNVALPILEALSKQHQILAVVTQPDSKVGRKQEIQESPVSVLATEMKLKILKPEKVRGNQEFYQQLKNLTSPSPNPSPSTFAKASNFTKVSSDESADKQGRGTEQGADIFVVVSYGQIMPLEVINLPKYKTINVHFSVLPKYRGASPIQSALLNGEEFTGTSIFILDEKVDHGSLLATEVVKIDADDNALTLSQKLAYKSAALINTVIEDYITGKIAPLPQDESAATHTKHIEKADGKIDWNKSAQEIYNQFRAFYPWPGVWTKWNGKLLKTTDIQVNTLQMPTELAKPGIVLDGGVVVCGQGTSIKIKSLQMEGKKEMVVNEFINGQRNFVGSTLN